VDARHREVASRRRDGPLHCRRPAGPAPTGRGCRPPRVHDLGVHDLGEMAFGDGNRGATRRPRPVLPGPPRAGGRLRCLATFGPTGCELAARCRPLSTGRSYPLPQPPTRLLVRTVPPTPTHWT